MQERVVEPVGVPRRGRPRAYDIEAVTAAALEVLWTKGYEETSVDDLVAATGLGPSSLYAAFGSKRGVMEAALTRYSHDRDAQLAPLERGTRGLEDIRTFLRTLRAGLTAPDSRGCFMVNSSAGVAARDDRVADQVKQYCSRLRAGLAAALSRAARAGETADGSELVIDRAYLLQAALFGAQLAARAGDAEAASGALTALEGLLDDWQRAAVSGG